MINTMTKIAIATTVFISFSANAMWGSDISIVKQHQPVAPESVKKNDNEVIRKVFEIEKTRLPLFENYVAETKSLYKLKYIDFDNVSTLDPSQLKLAYAGKEATELRELYVEMINAVKQIIDIKIEQRQQGVIESKKLSESYQMEIKNLEARQQGYRAAVQGVYDLKEQTVNAQTFSEQAVKDLSAALVAQLNQHTAIPKPLKNKYFERPKMKVGACKETIINKKTSVQLAYTVQGFCFSSKIRVEKNSANSLLNDAPIMSQLESTIIAIGLEKIKQGDTFKKQGGQSGYKQKIRSFSHGGIEDVKKAAKAEYGNTDKGFSFKIKSLNKKLAANNRKINAQIENALNIPVKELKHSQELKALAPLALKLDALSKKYLNAQLIALIGKPIKQSTENYQLIELDESNNLLLIQDSYPSAEHDQRELYLVNPTLLQENSKIKHNFAGKDIPARAAIMVNGMLLWRGNEAYYARTAPSIVNFLSKMK